MVQKSFLEENASPDKLLTRIMRGKRGHHRIYVGMAAGVGKTYRALQELHDLIDKGVDAIIGLLETHGREETREMAKSLELFPRKTMSYKGVQLTEMDLEGLLLRNPTVVLVDELAHTNVPNSKHIKRFEDVEVLLEAGINVISTMNVQHVESVNDLVTRLTGILVKERVPDRILRDADEVILVDVTPELLRTRLREGKIYSSDKIERSLNNFFTLDNLNILRELALRLVADAVEDVSTESKSNGIKDRIVVAITPIPNATKLIRRGARLAQRLNGELIVINVKNQKFTREQEKVLDTHQIITESLEGVFVRLEAKNPAKAISEFIQKNSVTQVIMGASLRNRFQEILRGSIIHRVLKHTQGVDILIVGRSF